MGSYLDGSGGDDGGDYVVDDVGDVDVDGDGDYVDVDHKNLSLLPLVEGAMEQHLPPLASIHQFIWMFSSVTDHS